MTAWIAGHWPAAGLVGRRRVLDSTPLYDAVATMDTVTLIRSAVRGLLAAGDADADLVVRLRAAIGSGDDYASTGKPVIDWDDQAARDALVDSRARDGYALLAVLDSVTDLPEPLRQAMRLLATAGPVSPLTSPSSPPRPTTPASPSSACLTTPAPAGPSTPAEPPTRTPSAPNAAAETHHAGPTKPFHRHSQTPNAATTSAMAADQTPASRRFTPAT
jgi:hypothetical protein